MEKLDKFIVHINDAIAQVFNEENENYIWELWDDDLNDFFYALMIIVPSLYYNKITWENNDMLSNLAVAQKLIVSKINQDHQKEIEKLNNQIKNNLWTIQENKS